MKTKFLSIIAAGLGALALTSNTTPNTDIDQKDIKYYGSTDWTEYLGYYMDEAVFHPHGEGDIDYKFVFRAEQTGSFYIRIIFKYIKNGSSGSEKNSRNEKVFDDHWNPTAGGQTKTISGTWNLKYDWEKRHKIICQFFCSSSLTAKHRYKRGFEYQGTEKETITAAKFPWKRPNTETEGSPRATLFGDRDWHVHYSRFFVDGQGFESVYEDPKMGVVPLSKMRFTCTGYFREPDNVSWKNGTLKIFNNVDSWSIGTKEYDSETGRYYRAFAVAPKHIGKETVIQLADTYYVRADGREMRSSKPVGSMKKYYETNQLFLPPNATSSPESYECQLVLDDFGEQESDIFLHDFTITKTHDQFGPGISSDYVLEEIL